MKDCVFIASLNFAAMVIVSVGIRLGRPRVGKSRLVMGGPRSRFRPLCHSQESPSYSWLTVAPASKMQEESKKNVSLSLKETPRASRETCFCLNHKMSSIWLDP